MPKRRITYQKTTLPTLPSPKRMAAGNGGKTNLPPGLELAVKCKVFADRINRFFRIGSTGGCLSLGPLFDNLPFCTKKPTPPADTEPTTPQSHHPSEIIQHS